MPTPSYLFLSDTDWANRIARADALASSCQLCPRHCNINRLQGQTGFCSAPDHMVVSSVFAHHGEEPPLTGTLGSGTVFFSHCTLKCAFCQNHQISQGDVGEEYSVERLYKQMLWLQNIGCHNVNMVTATHFLPWVLRAVQMAAQQGLTIPLVYNCGGYEDVPALKLLDSIVDIYLPDMKYGNDLPATAYSAAPDYIAVNRSAIREMFRQTGPLKVDKNGIATHGMIIRHLVLPNNQSYSNEVLEYLASTYDPSDIAISLMAQYKPLFRASDFPALAQPVSFEEYEPIRKQCIEYGFEGFFQTIDKLDTSFCIDFSIQKHESLI